MRSGGDVQLIELNGHYSRRLRQKFDRKSSAWNDVDTGIAEQSSEGGSGQVGKKDEGKLPKSFAPDGHYSSDLREGFKGDPKALAPDLRNMEPVVDPSKSRRTTKPGEEDGWAAGGGPNRRVS